MNLATEVKPGWKTTEFWITMAGNVAAVMTTVAGVLDPATAGIIMAVANGLYAISRGWAKKQ